METVVYDFGGYATRNDLKCGDNRIIRKDAFKDDDGKKVPLVWSHQHQSPDNVLGHGILENRPDGVYVYGKFNETPEGQRMKTLVQGGDIDALSIFANKLKQKGQDVLHGTIREVSLVLSGQNPGAAIDNLMIRHGDDSFSADEEAAVIYTDDKYVLELSDIKHAATDDKDDPLPPKEGAKTVQDVWDSMDELQQGLTNTLVEEALKQGDEPPTDDDILHNDEGGKTVKNNLFDTQSGPVTKRGTLTREQLNTIMHDAVTFGTLKKSFLAHAEEFNISADEIKHADYGIEDIDILFPDAKNIRSMPDMIKRETEWVAKVLNGTHHSPFSRIKSIAADITADEARAKGYMKGNLKKDEVITLLKRVTVPQTVYKKQKLDRDDIIDITDFDVVLWIKGEMQLMLKEELARAVLIGDGRDISSEDKIHAENIRPIWTDNDLYAHHVLVNAPASTSEDDRDKSTRAIIETVLRQRKNYKGTGRPTFFTTNDFLIDMRLLKDGIGHYLYPTDQACADALRVSEIVEVEVMEGANRTLEDDTTKVDLIGIMVNLSDYTIGADKGGQTAFFEDFDIDYNQEKYLYEIRCSGTLTKPKSAMVIERKQVA